MALVYRRKWIRNGAFTAQFQSLVKLNAVPPLIPISIHYSLKPSIPVSISLDALTRPSVSVICVAKSPHRHFSLHIYFLQAYGNQLTNLLSLRLQPSHLQTSTARLISQNPWPEPSDGTPLPITGPWHQLWSFRLLYPGTSTTKLCVCASKLRALHIRSPPTPGL